MDKKKKNNKFNYLMDTIPCTRYERTQGRVTHLPKKKDCSKKLLPYLGFSFSLILYITLLQ
jgi:hypothetical protein